MLRVEYEQTKADVLSFWRHHLFTAPYIRRLVIFAVAFGSLTNAAITYVRWAGRPDQQSAALWSALSTPLAFVVVGAMLAPPLFWMAAHFLLREGKNRGVLGRHSLVI